MPEENLKFEFPSVKIIPREEWGAVPPTSTQPLEKTPVYQIGFVSTKGPPCSSKEECILRLRRMQERHMKQLKMPDIAYNFYICADDLIFEGRGWNAKSDKINFEHLKWDGKSIDIGYIGVFNNEYPPLSVLEARDFLVSDGIMLRHIHRLSSYFN